MTELSASGVSFKRGRNVILNDVSVAVGRNEMVGLIGPNGAGKTTLLRLLAGLAKPDAGTIIVDGTPITKMPFKARARAIAYLAQNASCTWPMEVERVVALGRIPHLQPWNGLSSEDEQIIETIIQATDIAHLRHRKATTLSGGEQARMMLARALAVGSPMLLADEPVSGLDPGHQIRVMEFLKTYVDADRGVAVVLHDLDLAARYCTRLVLLSDSRVVGDGPPQDVLTHDALSAVYGVTARIEDSDGQFSVAVDGLSSSDGHDHHHSDVEDQI